eukprot:m.382710 g.382710  ORF g.382710 m.382710 type:complete len:262 (-) comp16723_c0_seq2:186-971(-)
MLRQRERTQLAAVGVVGLIGFGLYSRTSTSQDPLVLEAPLSRDRRSLPTQPRSTAATAAAIEDCGWKPNDALVGSCAGSGPKLIAASKGITNAADCAALCCSMPTEHAEPEKRCVAWQYRQDTGCRVGGDVRIGMEKDGPSAWCNHDPPAMWHGERVSDTTRDRVCGDGWNSSALPTQCFGLGDRQHLTNESPEGCRDACCADKTCKTWQFRHDVGCFYGPGGSSCDAYHAIAFTPWEGRRKLLKSRKYIPARDGAKRLKP